MLKGNEKLLSTVAIMVRALTCWAAPLIVLVLATARADSPPNLPERYVDDGADPPPPPRLAARRTPPNHRGSDPVGDQLAFELLTLQQALDNRTGAAEAGPRRAEQQAIVPLLGEGDGGEGRRKRKRYAHGRRVGRRWRRIQDAQ